MVKMGMQTICLSPHFDDVALSCGGLVWQKAQAGEQVSIWTICAGEIPPGPLSDFAAKLHDRWQTGRQAVEQRRQEDIASCHILGAEPIHLTIPDCIYRYREGESPSGRQHLYSEETFLGPIHPAEEELIERLAKKLSKEVPDQSLLISPLAIGGHVDHRLARKAAEQSGRELLYYADYPYCLKEPHGLDELEKAGWSKMVYKLPPSSLQAWQQGIAAHPSQISTFWDDLADMSKAIEAYYQQSGGCILWKAPTNQDIT
jgi:LmbE family N-acetylglucosaminyl deacetylase